MLDQQGGCFRPWGHHERWHDASSSVLLERKGMERRGVRPAAEVARGPSGRVLGTTRRTLDLFLQVSGSHS